MKIGKKIYLTLMVLFSAVCVFSACTKDPYKNMKLSVSTTSVTKEYSPDSADNFFDLSATVEGVDAKKVSTEVQFTIANTDIVDLASAPSINGATTTQKFAIKSTGRTSILVTTKEGGNDGVKRQTVDVNITSAIESLAFTYDTLPLVRGTRTDLTTNVYDGSGYLTYTPLYTTERNVVLTAIDSVTGLEITEGVVIDGNTITVTDSALTAFDIKATSAHNDQVVATTHAVVLEPISAEDFAVKQITDAGATDLDTFILQGKNAYDITIANADSVHETQNIKTVDVYANGISASGEGSAYTVRARGLNASGTAISGLNYVSARRNDNGTYTLGEGRGYGSDNIEFRVFYRGYENIFAPVTITLRVTVSSYPTLLQLTDSATSTTALENIVVYKDTDYVAQVGTPVFVRIASANGNLINQKAYVYVVDGDGNKVDNGIMIYRFVGGSMERVFANTPVTHGEQLFVNYVFNPELQGGTYALVAESALFGEVKSAPHAITLITQDINVSMPKVTMAQGSTYALTANDLMGVADSQIGLSSLELSSSDTDIVKVYYDEPSDTWMLSTEDTHKIGEATITVKAPNGKTTSNTVVVYTEITAGNTQFELNGVSYGVSTEPSEINITSGSTLVGNLIINGIRYDKAPQGMTLVATEFDNKVVNVASDSMTVFTLNTTATTTITFTLTNFYQPDEALVYRFVINVTVPVSALNINTPIANIYSINSISMDEYKDKTAHNIIVSASPFTAVLKPENFNFRVRYNGAFYEQASKHNNALGSLYTFELISGGEFEVYVQTYNDDPTMYTVTTRLLKGDTESYQFEVYVGYSQNYIGVSGEYNVTKSTAVTIITRDAVRIKNIYNNLGNKNIDFNTNQLVGDEGNWTQGHEQVFNFTINPSASNVFVSTVLVTGGDVTLDQSASTDSVLVYENDYLQITVDNTNGRVRVKLLAIPTDPTLMQTTFALAAYDSIKADGTYGVTSSFTVKINDGTSEKTAFTINTAEQLQDMQNDLDSFYVLSADIYMDGTFNARNPFTPVGTTDSPFTGHLSGAYEFKGNYAYYGIYNMWVGNTFDSTDPVRMPTNTYGLFGVNSGIVKDLSIVGLTVHVEYGTLDAGNVYVGAIAGINLGTIQNCSVISYSGLDASDTTLTALNGGNITTGVQLRDFSNTIHTSYVGGVAGVNASAITNSMVTTTINVQDTTAGSVVAGGMAGANTSLISESGKGYKGVISNEHTNSSFVNNTYDVLAIINYGTNADNVYKLTNTRSVVGGVVGINNFYSGLRTDTTTIDGTYVRALIGAVNNVGGVAGINSGSIYNVTVQPVLVAGDYVGGAVGTNYAGDHSNIFALDNTLEYTRIAAGSYNGSVRNTKVQFIDQYYTRSYLNTGIHAHSYVGGLVGAEYGVARGYNTANTYETLNMNSVYSYITREASGTYAIDNTSSAFYGDMVATGEHVGGLVGYGNHTDIVAGLVNIQAVTSGIYGGAVGTAIGALHLADIQVAGAVSGTTQVGGLVGDATAINDNLASFMSIDSGKLLPTTNQLVDHAQLGDGDINYHITTSYTVLKVADNYVANFAYTGNTISGTVQGVLRYLSEEGGVTYINYFSNSGPVKEVYTIPTVDDGNGNLTPNDVGTIHGDVQTTRNLLAVANSWYIGFNTIVNDADTTFTYDYVTSSTDRSAWTYAYDNLRNYDIVVQGAYSYEQFGLTGSDIVLRANTVIRGANNKITSVKAGNDNVRQYSIYSVTDGNSTGIAGAYNWETFYFNPQVFGGLPVSMLGIVDDKVLRLIFEIAPTDIYIAIESDYMGSVLDSSETIVALAYKGTNAQYALDDVIKLSVIPAFADSTKRVITSSNTNVLRVVDGNLVPVSAGVATLKVTSVYNASVTASVTVMVYNDVTEYALTDANGHALPESVTVVKGYTTTLNSNFTSTPANAVTGLLISSDVDTTFTINGTTLTAGNAVYFDTNVVSLYGVNKGDATLTYTPYIKHIVGGVTYIKYLDNYKSSVNVNVELGSYNFNTSGNITLSPVGNVEFEIAVDTDNGDLQLVQAVDSSVLPDYNQMTYTVSRNNSILNGEQLIDNDHITFDGILDLLWISSTYFEGIKTYTFSARVNANEFANITYARTYTISVSMLRYDGKVVEKEFNINILPQSLTNVILTHYSHVVNVSDDQLADPDLKEDQMQVYKYASNTLVPGYSGLLHIDLHPVYGQYDYLTVTSPAGDALQFEQMVEVANKGEYSTFASANTTSAVTGGIRISGKYSAINTGADRATTPYIYNGRIYVRTSAATSIQNTTIPVSVKCYLDDGTCVYTEDIDIVIVEPPYVSLGVGEGYGDKNAPIATGTDIIFRATSSGVTDAPVISVGGNTQDIRNLGGGLYQYTHNVSSLFDMINAIGSDITINATVSKTINNRVYSATDSITLRVAKYVVTDIQVNRVNNGYFEGKYNQIYPLRTTVYAKYNDDLYRFVDLEDQEVPSITIPNPQNETRPFTVTPIKSDLIELAKQIDALGLSGATPQTQTWFVKTGADSKEPLDVKAYDTFIVRTVVENETTTTLSIQNTVVSAMDTLSAVVRVAYGKDAEGENEYGSDGLKLLNISSTEPSSADYTYEFERPFTFNFTRINDGENPEPIYNADQFKGMKRGVHYILQSDIVLENWLPMEANFASLDGNSYVITIKSFGDLNPLYPAGTSTPYIGLFSTVSGDYDNVVENKSTVIKNLTVELLQDISINITDYTNVYFGVIAGYNEGVITNCQVINNANDLIAERNGMLTLLAESTKEKYPQVDVSTRIKNITGADTLPEAVSVTLVQGDDASVVSHGNYISGFVGQNVGYITNSAVRNITINGSDYVSGFVGSNSGTISSSYFKGGNVINNDSLTKSNSGTAGFVSSNSANATIQYSYVMGRVKETDITRISADDKKDYLGYAYRDELKLGTLRALNSMVLTNNYAGGFVYDNQGNIDNSYSNILVSGTGSAGFAYRNNGSSSLISYCYSLSSGTGSGFTPFSFKTTAGTSTSVRDCYYLQVDRQDTDNETYYEQLSNDARADGTAINANAFGDYNSFQAYAFNTDYSVNSTEEVTKAVWFIPTNTESGKMSNELTRDYLKDDYYYASRPELVGANLRVTPLRMYHVTDVGEDGKEGFTYNDATMRKSANPDIEGINITHGESVLNPYLVDTSAKFNIYCTPTSGKGENNVNDTSDAHIRFIKDITFDSDTQTAATYNTIFKGDIDGNGMQINNLRILADSIDDTSASDRVAGIKFGLFAEISGGSVRNLTINIAEINGVNVQCVGVLAGVISDRTEGTDGHTTTYNSVIANINVEGNVLVQGLNAVGGVAGVVLGDSFVINVTSNVSVKANYRGNVNMFSATNSVGTRVTSYNLFDENSNNGNDSHNFTNISYAGGIAGILHVDSNPDISIDVRNFGRARRAHITDNVEVRGQVVGGLFGYVGSNTTLSDSYMLVGDSTKLNATRVAGGLVGHNLGIIQRSYVAHAVAVQDAIDSYIANESNRNRIDNATTDIRIANTNYNVFVGNPHYMGGIVGINLGGTIFNSYNRVPVANINAEYAGGILGVSVGGNINSVYTTASVYAFRGIGGIIGVQTAIKTATNTVNGEPEAYIPEPVQLQPISGVNYENAERNLVDKSIAESIAENTTMRNIVGANIWLSSHTNTERSIVGKNPDANPALIGTIVGVTTHGISYDATNPNSIGGITVSTLVDRAVNESVYTKTQWTYASRNATAKGLIAEFGAINNNLGTMSTVLEAFKSSLGSSVKVIELAGNTYMLYGNHTLQGTGADYRYSRMQMISSSRTLHEIFNRISNVGSANNTYKAMGFGTNLESDVAIGGSAVPSKIYYNFSTAEWDGTRVDDSNNKISSEYVFPVLSTKAEPGIINVYSETDLRTMHTYLNSSFVLQNNIELTTPWEPVGTQNMPFRGKIYSKANAAGNGYEQYTIRNFSIASSLSTVGLIAYGEGVELHHFNVEVNSVTSHGANADVAVLIAQASSVGNARVTSIDNVNIIKNTENFILNGTNTVNSIGALVATGENITITNSHVTDASVKVNRAGVDGIYAGMAFGKLTGDNTWIDNIGTSGSLDINTNDTYKALAVGGVGGYIEIQPQKNKNAEGKIEILTDIHLRSNSAIKINPVSTSELALAGVRIGIGGTLGYIDADLGNYPNESSVDVEYKINLTDYAIDGINLYSRIDIKQLSSHETIDNKSALNIGSMVGYAGNINMAATSLTSFIEVQGYQTANIGGIVGSLVDGTLTNVNPNGSINADADDSQFVIGGIVGYASNSRIEKVTLSNYSIEAPEGATITAGGIVGQLNNSTLNYCYNLDTNISTTCNTAYVGGIVGRTTGTKCSINHAITSGNMTVTSSAAYVGGILGSSSATTNITNAINTANITLNGQSKPYNLGGLVGCVNEGSITINSSYATGNIYVPVVTHTSIGVGGLIGGILETTTTNLQDCYSLTNMIVDSNSVAGYQSTLNNGRIDQIVGYVGTNKLEANNTYAVAEFNPQLKAKVGTLITAHEFLTSETDFDTIIDTDTSKLVDNFKEKTTYSYPLLSWVDDANTYNNAAIKSIQAEGTKVHPAQLTTGNLDTLGDNKSIIIDSDASVGLVGLADNVVYLFNNISLSPVSDDIIFGSLDANSLLIGNNKSIAIGNGQSPFISSNSGKVVGLNISSSAQSLVINSNTGIVFGCTLLSSEADYIVNSQGVIDSCQLLTQGIAIHSTNEKFLLINSKITDASTLIDSMNSNYTIKDSYYISGHKEVTYYGNSGTPTTFDTIADATAINNFGGAGLSMDKFMLVKSNANNVDNILRLRWEFKDYWFDEDISPNYIWSSDGASGGYTDTGSAYEVSTAEGLAYVLQNIKESYQIKLMNDIDLGGKLWIPINNTNLSGTINGNGHTISNMSVYVVDNANVGADAGFIADYSGSLTIENVKFNNASSFAYATGTTYDTGFANAAILVAKVDNQDEFTAQSVAVDRCSVLARGIYSYYAGMIGEFNGTGKVSFKDTYTLLVGHTANNCYGYVGRANSTSSSSSSTIAINSSYMVFLSHYSGDTIPALGSGTKYAVGGTSGPTVTTDSFYVGNDAKLWFGITENIDSNLTALQSEYLAGFDWANTWMRVPTGDNSLWQLPQLTGQMLSWQQYAEANKDRLGAKYSSLADKTNVKVENADDFAYVMWQLTLPSRASSDGTLPARTLFTNGTASIELKANIDLGAHYWEPTVMVSSINVVTLTSDANRTINNLSVASENAGLFGVNTTTMYVTSINFANARVFGSSSAGVLFAKLNNFSSVNDTNTQHTLSNIEFTDCKVVGGQSAGLLGAQICNASIRGVIASGGSVRVTSDTEPTNSSTTYLGGLVGLSQYNKYFNCECSDTKISSENVAFVGGIIGDSQNDREINGLTSNANSYSIKNAVYVGGAIGELELTSDAQRSLKVSAITVTNLNMLVDGTITTGDTDIGGAFGYTNNNSGHELVIENIHLGTAKFVKETKTGYDEGYFTYVDTLIKRVLGGGTLKVSVGNNGYVGGVVGRIESKVKLYELYSDITVTSSSKGYVSGVVGYMNGNNNTLSNIYCYNTDIQTSDADAIVGALVGYIADSNNIFGIGYSDYTVYNAYNSVAGLDICFDKASGDNHPLASVNAKWSGVFDQSSSWTQGDTYSDVEYSLIPETSFYIPLWAVVDLDGRTTRTMADMVNALPAKDSAGDYQVSTYAQLQSINDYIRYRYNNTQSINIDIINNFTIDNSVTFRPLGSRYYPYSGTLNGGEHTITISYSNNINPDADCFGLIGYMYNGSVADLNVKVTSSIGYLSINNISNTGVVVGYASNSNINNIYVYATSTDIAIKAYSYVGGVIGKAENNCTITNIHNGIQPSGITDTIYAVGVAGQGGLGGLIGSMSSSTITNSSVIGVSITGNVVQSITWHMGGAIGTATNSNIGNASSTSEDISVGSVTFTTTNSIPTRVGGIVGGAYSTNIYYCGGGNMNMVNANGQYIGGIVGEFFNNDNNNDYVVTNCSVYLNNELLGDSYIGGIIGYYDFSKTKNSSAATIINNKFDTAYQGKIIGSQCVGGIIGCIVNERIPNNFFNDIAASKLSDNKVEGYIEANIVQTNDEIINTFKLSDFGARVDLINKDASDWKRKVQFNLLDHFQTDEDNNKIDRYYIGTNHIECTEQSSSEYNSNKYVPFERITKGNAQSLLAAKNINFVIGNIKNIIEKQATYETARIFVPDNHTLVRLSIIESNYIFKENGGFIGGVSRTLTINNLRIDALRCKEVFLQGNGSYYSSKYLYGEYDEVMEVLPDKKFSVGGTDWDKVKDAVNNWLNSSTDWTINWSTKEIVEG